MHLIKIILFGHLSSELISLATGTMSARTGAWKDHGNTKLPYKPIGLTVHSKNQAYDYLLNFNFAWYIHQNDMCTYNSEKKLFCSSPKTAMYM